MDVVSVGKTAGKILIIGMTGFTGMVLEKIARKEVEKIAKAIVHDDRDSRDRDR